MMTSSKMNCSAVHASLHIVNHLQALVGTANNSSPAVSKKERYFASKCNKGDGGTKPPVGVIPPPPSPPSKEDDTTINKVGSFVFLILFLPCFI